MYFSWVQQDFPLFLKFEDLPVVILSTVLCQKVENVYGKHFRDLINYSEVNFSKTHVPLDFILNFL